MPWLKIRRNLRDAANAIADAVYAKKTAEVEAIEQELVVAREREAASRDELVNAINTVRTKSANLRYG